MKLVFIDVKFTGKIVLTKECIKELKKHNKIAVYTTTQFNFQLPEILKQLDKNNISHTTSKPERTNAEYQILGCDVYKNNLNLEENVDAFLYIGDGKFHPRAILFSENDKGTNRDVIMFNPTNNKTIILKKSEIEKVIKKENANKKRFLMGENIGVIITTKPGQEHIHFLKKLEESFPKKSFYAFISDTINISEMENFPYIDAWINTACPRLGLEDSLTTTKAILNVEETLKLAE